MTVELLRICCFVLGTWGVVLGVPVVAMLSLRMWLPLEVAVSIGLVLLVVGVLFGEWLARGMNWVLGRRFGRDSSMEKTRSFR
ncbi:MAG: hypothetical protein AAGF12_01010 [Myxococcota bacterium]